MQSRLDGSEVRCPLHLSLHRFHAPAPPSLLRVPLGSVPRTHRYYETLRLPAIHPGGLVDSPAGTALALLASLSPLASTTRDGPGFWSPGSPTGFFGTEKTGSPEFLSSLPLSPSFARRTPRSAFFCGRQLAEERVEIGLSEFASRFEAVSSHTLGDLASRYREPDLIRGRIEFVTLALPRYGFRGRDVAELLGKHGNSITMWLGKGLCLEQTDPDFERRLDQLDAEISPGG